MYVWESIVETEGRLGAASAVLPETLTISVYGFFSTMWQNTSGRWQNQVRVSDIFYIFHYSRFGLIAVYFFLDSLFVFHSNIWQQCISGIKLTRVYTGRKRPGVMRKIQYRTYYNDAVYTGCGATCQIPDSKNWCIILFMTYWHKVQMICNSHFVASSADPVTVIKDGPYTAREGYSWQDTIQ